MKLEDEIIEWPQENVLERCDRCRAMLTIHGFLSDAESKRVRERLTKWFNREFARQAQVSGGRK